MLGRNVKNRFGIRLLTIAMLCVMIPAGIICVQWIKNVQTMLREQQAEYTRARLAQADTALTLMDQTVTRLYQSLMTSEEVKAYSKVRGKKKAVEATGYQVLSVSTEPYEKKGFFSLGAKAGSSGRGCGCLAGGSSSRGISMAARRRGRFQTCLGLGAIQPIGKTPFRRKMNCPARLGKP